MLSRIRGTGRLLNDQLQVATARYELHVVPDDRSPQVVSGHLWVKVGTPVIVTSFVPLRLVLNDERRSVLVIVQEPVFEISHYRYTVYPTSWLDPHESMGYAGG